jgi:hypothetical protein
MHLHAWFGTTVGTRLFPDVGRRTGSGMPAGATTFISMTTHRSDAARDGRIKT